MPYESSAFWSGKSIGCSEHLNMIGVTYVLSSGLLKTTLSILFYLILKVKKMRKIYSSFFLVAAGLVMAMDISACSENEEDIAAPLITIYKDNKLNVLAEGDTVALTTYSYVTSLNLYIEATNDNVPMKEMTLELKCLSNPSIKDIYSPESFQLNNETYYYYPESFYLNNKITEIIRMQLNITCENYYDHTKTLYRKFYIKP